MIRREPLVAAVIDWGGRRLWLTGALVVAGGLLDGLGILMLVPVIELAGSGGEGRAGRLMASLGLESPEARLGALIAVFTAILFLRFAVVRWRDLGMLRLREGFVVHLRRRLFGLVARAGWARAAALDLGRAGHALTSSIDRAAVGAGLLIDLGVASLMLAVQLAFALAIAPLLALLAAVAGAGVFAALRPLRARARLRGERLTTEGLGVFLTSTRFLAGLKPATAHGLVDDYVAAHGAAAERLAAEGRAFGADHSLARLLLQTGIALIAVVLVVIGVFALDTPPELLIVLMVLFARVTGPLMQIQSAIQHIRSGGAAYVSVTELLEPLAGNRAAPAAAPAIAAPPEIAFEGVSVAGEDGAPILERVDALVPAGAVTALAGPSGAGKTTLCDLAAGLTTPDTGRVLLDGAPLDPARLAPRLAYVGQEPFMIEDSLRANLLWGAPAAGDDDILAALETVGAAGLVAALPHGLETRVRSEGVRFSGGERQRLRLARALLRRPAMIILDEATGALDPDAEAEVLSALFAARGGATVLMVSHREATHRLADRVIRLEAGRVAGGA